MRLLVTILLKISKLISFGGGQSKVRTINITNNSPGYIPVNVGLSAQDDGMRIMAIGDLNNDKQSDLVTTNESATALKAWYFNQSSYKYDKSADLTLPSGLTVDSVIVTKGQDPLTGLQHLLVTASDASST